VFNQQALYGRERRPTLRQVIRGEVVEAQRGVRRISRYTPVRQRSVHRVRDHHWSAIGSSRS